MPEKPIHITEEKGQRMYGDILDHLTTRRDEQGNVPASQSTSNPATQQLVKATFYLTPAHILSLEELKVRLLREKGEKIDKSELVRRAIDLLMQE